MSMQRLRIFSFAIHNVHSYVLACRDRGRIYRGLAATLAGLHSLEPAALGLTGFGNPQHYCRCGGGDVT